MVTYKNFKEQMNIALSEYKKANDIDEQEPEAIFIDAFTTAFNIDKIPSKETMEEILFVALNGDSQAVEDAINNIEKYYFE